ncbi:TetR/AcrR family transcriptional regulator [Paenibacillus albiflavus]|uniref:TetR/AcrR family transcriptional regulator n=1 Tax=Paenibacillus albiflavus TaxID=2545760 RepID=A0A4R4EM73_9BACL|nr:TetR/AcrR family transcriptional regulator [Paenibacillus albiflavus]TCZ80907.1 TetR/AcrR family transcriptional regulator [Paenibacillus albiflavus]
MSPRIGLDMTTIIKAAVDIADALGLEAVTLATLAKKLNIRPPSLYNHFDGLPGLRIELAIHGLEELRGSLMNAAIGRSEDDAIYSIADAYIAFVRKHPGLYEATLPAPGNEDDRLQQLGSDIVHIFTRVLQSYGIEGDAAIHTTRGLRSLLHGFASLEAKGGFGIPLDLDVSIKQMLHIFLVGIRSVKE